MSTEEVEVKARELGWAPKEEFRGNPEKWVDAETFVKRGEEILPLVKAQNRKLQNEVTSLQRENAEIKGLLRASSESIEELKNFNTTVAKERAQATKEDLLARITEAKKAGDVETETRLQDQLTQHNEAIRAAEKPPAEKKPDSKVEWKPPPEMAAWMSENPWFGTDKRRTALANGIADELRSDPANAGLKGKEFFDRITEEVEKVFGGNQRRNGAPKVEESRGSGQGGGGGSGGKTYADLPADAKAACERQGTRLVGKGRAFTTQEEWRRHYVSKYFPPEE